MKSIWKSISKFYSQSREERKISSWEKRHKEFKEKGEVTPCLSAQLIGAGFIGGLILAGAVREVFCLPYRALR